MEIPQGNTLKISGKQNPETGFESPRAEEEIRRATLLIDFPTVFKIDSGRKICHCSGHEQEGFKG
jgi:hypothetical protein